MSQAGIDEFKSCIEGECGVDPAAFGVDLSNFFHWFRVAQKLIVELLQDGKLDGADCAALCALAEEQVDKLVDAMKVPGLLKPFIKRTLNNLACQAICGIFDALVPDHEHAMSAAVETFPEDVTVGKE